MKRPNLSSNKVMSQKPSSWIWIFLLAILIFNFFSSNRFNSKPYSEFLELIHADQVQEVIFDGDRVQAQLVKAEGEKVKEPFVFAYKVEDASLVPLLKEKKIKFSAAPQNHFLSNLVFWIFPLLLIFLMFRRGMGKMPGGGLLPLSKSKAKIYLEKTVKTQFSDVAGVDEAKEELQEVVNFLKDQKTYSRLGGRAPKGILLVGPPGTGKTLMAKAVAGEASVPFFSINGSEFVELFVGMGAARVRDLFEQARSQSPCIIFIDELDALGKSRALGGYQGGANDEKEQTLNQLLAELDGFDSSSGVVLLAATNRPEVLDPALLRAGRFDRQVLLDNPDQRGRLLILRIHAKKVILDQGVDLEEVAALTPGFSGADLANLVNEAALIATRRNAEAIELKDFTNAVERIVAGLERKQRLISPDEKKRVAFHEMGHATVALALQCQDKVQKISIIPRGIGALGYTLQRPIEDRYLMTKSELLAKVSVLLGGRVAESQLCGDISTGASDDLVKASNIARSMITQYGMSEVLGLVAEENSGGRFLSQGPLSAPRQRFSEKTGEKIDNEVKAILEERKEVSEKIIAENEEFIRMSVAELLQKETLEAEEIQKTWERLGKVYNV